MKLRFWAAAAGAAAAFSLLLLVAMPWELLGGETPEDRRRMALLTLWTSGVMCICFGAAGLASSIIPVGFRDVAQAGSVKAAVEERREARGRMRESPFYNFAGWVVAMGTMLIISYFVVWVSP